MSVIKVLIQKCLHALLPVLPSLLEVVIVGNDVILTFSLKSQMFVRGEWVHMVMSKNKAKSKDTSSLELPFDECQTLSESVYEN